MVYPEKFFGQLYTWSSFMSRLSSINDTDGFSLFDGGAAPVLPLFWAEVKTRREIMYSGSEEPPGGLGCAYLYAVSAGFYNLYNRRCKFVVQKNPFEGQFIWYNRDVDTTFGIAAGFPDTYGMEKPRKCFMFDAGSRKTYCEQLTDFLIWAVQRYDDAVIDAQMYSMDEVIAFCDKRCPDPVFSGCNGMGRVSFPDNHCSFFALAADASGTFFKPVFDGAMWPLWREHIKEITSVQRAWATWVRCCKGGKL